MTERIILYLLDVKLLVMLQRRTRCADQAVQADEEKPVLECMRGMEQCIFEEKDCGVDVGCALGEMVEGYVG
jgi:hypothetical protein